MLVATRRSFKGTVILFASKCLRGGFVAYYLILNLYRKSRQELQLIIYFIFSGQIPDLVTVANHFKLD